MLNNIPLKQVKVKDGFWSPKLDLYQDITLIDAFEKFENDRGGAINNFDALENDFVTYGLLYWLDTFKALFTTDFNLENLPNLLNILGVFIIFAI